MTQFDEGPFPLVRFPLFIDLGDLNALSIVIQDLSLIYDVTAIAVLPDYDDVYMPAERIGPRRRSPLRGEDRLLVKRVSLASPLEIVFWGLSVSSSTAAIGVGFSRVAAATKAWIDVLSAGVDLQQRRQALELNRAMGPEQLREAQLRNALLQRQLREVSVPPESGLVEDAAAESRDPSSASAPRLPRPGRHRRAAGAMTSNEFAELLDDPVRRLLGYAGGELQIAGDESMST
jgi:hypothetical protein